jgi:hypothetical protein
MNGMLVTVKAEETISMVKNVAIPFIEMKDCKDENLHAFEIVNTEWVPESTMLRKPRISEAARMAAKCFLERGIPFQYHPITRIPKRINPIKMRCADQRLRLGYKPKMRIIVGLLIDEEKEEWLESREKSLKKKKWKSLPLWCLSQRQRM